jgi:hypothetical protein
MARGGMNGNACDRIDILYCIVVQVYIVSGRIYSFSFYLQQIFHVNLE